MNEIVGGRGVHEGRDLCVLTSEAESWPCADFLVTFYSAFVASHRIAVSLTNTLDIESFATLFHHQRGCRDSSILLHDCDIGQNEVESCYERESQGSLSPSSRCIVRQTVGELKDLSVVCVEAVYRKQRRFDAGRQAVR